MPERSLTYFLFFLLIWCLYVFYEQNQEAERLFKIATNQQETIIKQTEALEAQKVYIKLLEAQVVNSYYKKNSFDSPLYD